jgi:hypothetical protein
MAKSKLPRASGVLNTRFPGANVNYDKLYKAILDGRLPAVQTNGRYEIDLDVAAEVLDLVEHAA